MDNNLICAAPSIAVSLIDSNDSLLKSPVFAGCIQFAGLLIVSFLYPLFQERKRKQHEAWKNSIEKKEHSMALFSKILSETMLIQSLFKNYNYCTTLNSFTKNSTMAKAYFVKAEKMYMEYVKINTPFDTACKIAKLEFNDIEDLISEIEEYVKLYVELPSCKSQEKDKDPENNNIQDITIANKPPEENPLLKDIHKIINCFYEKITESMAITILETRGNAPKRTFFKSLSKLNNTGVRS